MLMIVDRTTTRGKRTPPKQHALLSWLKRIPATCSVVALLLLSLSLPSLLGSSSSNFGITVCSATSTDTDTTNGDRYRELKQQRGRGRKRSKKKSMMKKKKKKKTRKKKKKREKKKKKSKCDDGCDLSEGGPVCGEDKKTYLNSCLAVCQGVDVVRTGTCKGHPPVTSYVRKGRVPLTVLQRFKHRGFKYVDKRRRIEFVEDTEVEIIDIPEGMKRLEVREVLFTPEGDEYISDDVIGVIPDDDEDGDGDDADGDDGDGDGDGEVSTDSTNRELAIIDADTRSRVSPTTQWPFSLVGNLHASGRLGGCTATVVSMDSVVTAAHCLYDWREKSWTNLDTFSPARYIPSPGRVVNPYGQWEVEKMHVYDLYQNYGYSDYDFAIVKLKPRDGKEIGAVTGYAGIRFTTSSSPYLQNCRVIGYPGDKGRADMWTSNSCAGTWSSTTTYMDKQSKYRIYHKCDTTRGNSGSPFLDLGGVLHGIHYSGISNTKTKEGLVNAGNILNTMHYNQLKIWSGRTSDAPYKIPSGSSTGTGTGTRSTYFKVIVQYNKYPSQTGWYIKDLTTNKIIKGTSRRISQKFPPNKRLRKRMPSLVAGRQYLIYMSDSGGDGFCCGRSDGKRGSITILAKQGRRTVFKKKVLGRFTYARSVTFTMPDLA